MQPLVYEINTRCWLHELSTAAQEPITLGRIPDDQFTRWTKLGFTHIWLMGVWECGPPAETRSLAAQKLSHLEQTPDPDAAPSPYAITDYKVPDSLGGNDALRRFRERLLQHKLKLILDFVPNHTSCVHRWVKERREFYVQSAKAASGFFRSGSNWIAYGKDPYFPAWNDTAQLDYRNPATCAAMIGELLRVAHHCDGARCDMSMLVLNDVFADTWRDYPAIEEDGALGRARPTKVPPHTEFWSEAISELRRSYPEFLFLAEAYWDLEQRLLDLGFDYAYDKRIYDHLIARNPVALKEHLQSKRPEFLARTCHFLENHDEARIASLLDFEEHRAASLLMLMLPGMRLIHDGQLSGAKVRASVHRRSRPTEARQLEIAEWYERVLRALKGSNVGRGRFEFPSAPDGCIATRWQSESDCFDVAATNFTATLQHLEIELPAGNWEVQDYLEAASRRVNLHGKMRTVLGGHGAGFWRFRREQQKSKNL